MSEWISVEDALPKTFWGIFLVCREGSGTGMAARWNGEKFIVTDMALMREYVAPTHWMPFPESPKG